MAADRRGSFQAEAELPAVRVETRHMQAVLRAQINKMDRQPVRSVDKVIKT
jgi:transposase